MLARRYFRLANIASIYLVLSIFYSQLHMKGVEQKTIPMQANGEQTEKN
jgi:hypothetical protein